MRSRVLLAALVTVAAAFAQTKPNFSGNWKLDPLRSRFDKIPEPKSGAMKIDHQEPKLQLDINMVEPKRQITRSLELLTDGSEHKEPNGTTATAYWDGDHLVVSTKEDSPDGQVQTTRRLRLGDKGQTLTTVLTIKDKSGERSAYGFYVKE